VAEPLLSVTDVVHAYGGVQAVNGCTFDVPEGVICGLIGPNGAGKTTLVDVVAGALHLQRGSVRYAGADVGGWPPDRLARAGLIRTFQLSREFRQLTVLENLLVAATGRIDESLVGALFRRRQIAVAERALVKEARGLLEIFGLDALRNDPAETLSGGQKRLLELARAVMAHPRLLLLDEPMAGINPALMGLLEAHIRRLNSQGITFLMVEHNLGVVDRMCEPVVVMAEGKALAVGSMADHRASDAVVTAYLGRGRPA
jgi:ABC-type branched-subunit amino acid transport system ATPase component